MRVVFIGFDSMRTDFARKFMEKGYMPNMLMLKREGFFAEAIPTYPPLTPPGWATIATGAWPSTTGIEDFYLHRAGKPFDLAYNGSTSEFCKAETIWEVAEKNGKKVILLKYPGSWPPTIKKGIQVDGAAGFGGQRCRFALSDSCCYTTDPSIKRGELITLKEAKGWINIPKGYKEVLEAELYIKDREGSIIKKYYLLAFSNNGMQKIIISNSRDFKRSIVSLLPGEWSNWILDVFESKEGPKKGSFKMKLLDLKLPYKLKLYRSQIHQNEGFTIPEELSKDILENIGPFFERTAPDDFESGWIDLETQMEIYEAHTDWMCKTATYLLKKYEWDLFMTQWHPIDYAQHIVWGAIDPGHPDYNPEKAYLYWDFLGKVYRLADRLLGEVVQHITNDTIVIITADHGHELMHTHILINNFLVREGFLCVHFNEKGEPEIDWSKTKAYAFGMLPQIFINLKGRDPQGTVEPGEEYEKLRDEIIEKLYELRDPERGKHVIKMAVKKEEMKALGLYGENVGDIIFMTERGYMSVSTAYYNDPSWGLPVRELHMPPKITKNLNIFERTKLFKMHTSEHPSFSPFSEAIRVPFLMKGPGVKRGIERVVPVRLVDVAPTIAHILEVPMPKNSEGSIILDAFETDSVEKIS